MVEVARRKSVPRCVCFEKKCFVDPHAVREPCFLDLVFGPRRALDHTHKRIKMSSNQNSYHLGVQTTSRACMCKSGKKCPVDADGTRRERLLRGPRVLAASLFSFLSPLLQRLTPTPPPSTGDLRYCSMTTAHPGRKFYRVRIAALHSKASGASFPGRLVARERKKPTYIAFDTHFSFPSSLYVLCSTLPASRRKSSKT